MFEPFRIIFACVLSLILVACGGVAETTTSPAPEPVASQPEPEAEEASSDEEASSSEEEMEEKSIVEIAVEDGRFVVI